MSETAAQLTLYGADWCGDCRRAKKFLGEHRVPYTWVDITDDAEAIAFVERVNEGKRRIPTLHFTDQSALSNPSNADLATKLGLQTEAELDFYDVIIVGSGPAGLTAALYLAREGENVLVIERGGLGGQAGITDRLDNFPGFPDGIRGDEFADRLVRQARRFGVEILQATEVAGVRRGENLCVGTAAGKEYGARAVLIAAGATYRRLGVPGEDDFLGAGVHFCATCDGPFYKGEHVAVVGSGNSALEESIFLTRFADKVTLLVRGVEFKASRTAVEKLREMPQIEVRFQTEVKELRGDGKLAEVVVRDRSTGDEETLHPAALFVFIGMSPNVDWLPEVFERDASGFLLTDKTLQTALPGVFAAGDVRAGATAQAASAAGEGATAALMVRGYLKTV